MKRKLPLFICVLLLMAALPFTATANGATLTEPLDFTLDSADPGYPGASGTGWSWEAGAKVLTLSGINVDVDDHFAIKLPDGAKIVLAEGTTNNIANSYGRGIFCEGSLLISGGGNLNLNTNAMGFRVRDNLTVDISGNLVITVTGDDDSEYCPMGLCVGNCEEGGGDLVVRNCNTFSITSLDYAIRCFGNVSISGCGEVALLSTINDGFVGIRSFAAVTISDCPKVSIVGQYNGIRSSGDVLIAHCPDIAVRANRETDEDGPGHGIYADNGSVTITDSHLTVYGANFGIVTGPVCDWNDGYDYGGDIVINNSYVDASCDPEYGYAAIYAGDDLDFNNGEGEHARILLNGCAIILPEEGRVLDVRILLFGCQSITGLSEIEEISSWGQAAKRAIIGPLFTLAYDANGGGGSMSNGGAYAPGATVIVLPSSFTAPAGFVFTGWNTAADGSGTAYAPGATFVLNGNATLFAQYAQAAYTVTFDSQGGSKVDPVKAAGNSTITEPAAPVREDYIFGGWYKEKECKNAWAFASNVVTEDMTLYAKWTPKGDLPTTAGESTASIPPLAVVLLVSGILILHRCRKAYA